MEAIHPPHSIQKTLMRTLRTHVALITLVVASVAACGEAPTSPTPGARPLLDGHTLGSGHIVEVDTTQTMAATSTIEVTASDSSGDGRGGHTLGSGH